MSSCLVQANLAAGVTGLRLRGSHLLINEKRNHAISRGGTGSTQKIQHMLKNCLSLLKGLKCTYYLEPVRKHFVDSPPQS